MQHNNKLNSLSKLPDSKLVVNCTDVDIFLVAVNVSRGSETGLVVVKAGMRRGMSV